MAKLTAGGDKPVVVWEGPGGYRLVLTEKGRLLLRSFAGAGYTLLGKGYTLAKVERLAQAQELRPARI